MTLPAGSEVRRYGEAALLVEWGRTTPELRGWLSSLARGWERSHPPAVRDLAVADRSLVIALSEPTTPEDPAPEAVLDWIAGWKGVEGAPAPRRLVIEVIYDGPDLAAVARATGRNAAEVVRMHAGAAYRVGWLGFLPGFAYLEGLPAGLRLPRRSPPRSRMAAGAVAIAEGMSAVYPSPSPGGWHWIGRTAQPWRPWGDDLEPVWRPGDEVRFVAVGVR